MFFKVVLCCYRLVGKLCCLTSFYFLSLEVCSSCFRLLRLVYFDSGCSGYPAYVPQVLSDLSCLTCLVCFRSP